MNTFLIDTNVLLYAYETDDVMRSVRAAALLRQVHEIGAGRLSVQCLAEFFSVVTRKFKPPLKPAEALEQLEYWADSFPVLDLTAAVIREAARGVRDHQLQYYDAQMWAVAKLNQIPIVLTEDIPSSGAIEGIRFVNPLADKFVMEEWI
jgi:predicted nucleic acid-binding protein